MWSIESIPEHTVELCIGSNSIDELDSSRSVPYVMGSVMTLRSGELDFRMENSVFMKSSGEEVASSEAVTAADRKTHESGMLWGDN